MCKQISDFTVKTVLCANGERLPTLLHSNNGMPDFDATLWVVTSLRSQNVASATIEQALRSIKILYLVLQSKKIALSERLREGRILDPAEIELICKAAKQTTSTTASEAIKQEKTEPHRIAKGVVSLEKFRLRMTTRDNNIDVDSGTTAIRMSYIRAFLNWRINREIFRANGEKKTDLLMLRNLVDAEMKSKSPSTPGRATISTRTGIDRQAQTLLLAVVTPDHLQNPWTGEFIKSRNQLIVNLLIALGVRRGELLGMRINDIKPRSQDVEILRRPDDITDPRLNESNTKTRDRVLPLSPELYHMIKKYMLLRHDIVHGRHDFLIVSKNGEPLSKSETNRIFRDLDEHHALRGIGPHTLRHTKCENLADELHKAGKGDVEILGYLRQIGGWSDTSKTPYRYTKRFAQERAAEADISLQKSLYIHKAEDKHEKTH